MADPANSVAVATGSLVVTGTLTSFVAAENDLFTARGAAVPIARRDGPNQITLKQPWPLASLTGEEAWSILSLGEYWRSAISINRRLVELLAKWEVVAPLRFDAAGPLSERSAYNDQPKGFVYAAVDQIPVRVYIKLANTNSEADWSVAIYIGSGGQVEFEEAVADERQARINADAVERDRATGVEQGLRTDLSAETARATAAEQGLDLTTEFARTTLVEGGANDTVAIADPAGFIIALFNSLGIHAPSFIGSAFEGKSFSLQDAAAAAIALGLSDPNGFIRCYIDRDGDFQSASISISGSNDPDTIFAVVDPAGFALLALSAREGLRVAGPSSGNAAKLDPLGLPPLPVNSRIAWFGDSLFGRGKYDDDPLIGNTGWGMTTWAKTVCGSCWYESPGNNFGVSGNTLDEMIPRLPLLAEARPDLAVVLAGTNSVSTSSDRDMIRKLNIIFRAILANIPRLVVVKMIPRYDAGWTAEHEGRRKRVNAWIETQASDRLVVLDIEATVTPALLADGIHPMSPQAAYVVGKRIGDFLSKFIASKAVNMMAGVRTGFAPNPQMGGAGGDKQARTGATPVPTGAVADGYVLIADGGVTATASKVYDDFGNEGQRIVLSGTHVGTNVDILLAVSGDLSSGAPKAGDAIEAFVEFTVRGAPVGIAAIAASSLVYTAGYAAAIGALRTWVAMDRAIDIIPPGLVDRRTVMRSPPKVLNNGVPAIVPQAVVISLQNSASPAPVSLTLDLWGMNTRTVPSRI